MDGESPRGELLERLTYVLVKNNIPIDDIRQDFMIILKDYNVKVKSTDIVVYQGDKNELFLQKFVIGKTIAGLSKRSIQQYINGVRFVLRKIGKSADEITPEDLQYYFACRMRDGVSKSFIDTERRYLSSFYSYLLREELITKNPVLKIDKIKFQKKKEPAFTELEVEQIRTSCKNTRETAIVEMLMSTGARVSELCSIKYSDIDNDAVSIIGKGGKQRMIYLNAKAQIAVSRYMAERKDCNPYLFPRSKPFIHVDGVSKGRVALGDWYKDPELVEVDGCADVGTIRNIIQRIAKRAGVENAHPHRFRRTCATFALRRGMPIEQVSKMLGHAEIATTQIYLDLTDDELEAAHKRYVV